MSCSQLRLPSSLPAWSAAMAKKIVETTDGMRHQMQCGLKISQDCNPVEFPVCTACWQEADLNQTEAAKEAYNTVARATNSKDTLPMCKKSGCWALVKYKNKATGFCTHFMQRGRCETLVKGAAGGRQPASLRSRTRSPVPRNAVISRNLWEEVDAIQDDISDVYHRIERLKQRFKR